MSYCSRVYRHRNTHVNDETVKEPFFIKQHDVNKSIQKAPFFQAKLTVNEPGDHYEREADSVANAVVNNSHQTSAIPRKKISGIPQMSAMDEKEKLKGIQKMDERKKEEEDKKKITPVQTKHEATATTSSPQVSSQIEQSSGKGSVLPQNTLHEMSASFGVDFSNVRVHNDSEAAAMSKDLQAQAFTHGNDIYFDEGKYNPQNSEGKFLLAHELTHVVQQNQGIEKPGNIQRTIGDANDLSSPRFKGDVDLEACFDGEKIIKSGNRGEAVRKIQQALIDAGFPLPKFGADSIFGSETKAAIKEFQKQSGLDFGQQDGEVGPITLSRLDSRFTGASANTVEQTCASGNKTVTIDFAMMKGATGNPANDIAFANNVFKDCCINFKIGTQVNVPDSLSDSLLGGDTDLLMANCGAVSSEDLNTFLTTTSLLGLTSSFIAFYVSTLHQGTERLGGDSVSGLCATGPRAPMQGMVAISNGVDARTFPHELAHVLMNTFSDHRVTKDNLQHVSAGAAGEKIAPVQCAIMYTRAK